VGPVTSTRPAPPGFYPSEAFVNLGTVLIIILLLLIFLAVAGVLVF
jgi:hypothetical protein